MADVYRARDTELPREVAIKILKPESQHDEAFRQAFSDEVQLATRCSHDNIVTIHDKGEFQGNLFIVMEFLRGDHLGVLIKERRLGNLREVLRIASQIAAAMSCVHGQNIVHRDLKALNIHVDTQGRVKLVDFGISKSVDWDRTAAGFVKGTPQYMAPEQVLGQTVSFRTDIWAFGVVLFEMLSGGTRPFSSPTLSEIWLAIANNEPDYQLLEHAGVPDSVQRIVKRCLQKDPAGRYGSFNEIQQDIAEAVKGQGKPKAAEEPPTVSEVYPSAVETVAKSRNWLWAIAGLALVALAAGYFVFAARHPKPAIEEQTAQVMPAKELQMTSGNMEFVPGGAALLGEDKHKVDVAPFYIDKTEVNNRAYGDFLNATGYRMPADFQSHGADDPVVNVSYYDAEAFAKWAGKRLPKADEWEKAARGTTGQAFPWGDEPDTTRANVKNNSRLKIHALMPVDSFPEGASPYGVFNLCGNVWEWVDLRLTPSAENLRMMRTENPSIQVNDAFYAIKGGNYKDFGLTPRFIWDVSEWAAKAHTASIGFRCAMSPKP